MPDSRPTRRGHGLTRHREGRFVTLFVLALSLHVFLPLVRGFQLLTFVAGLLFVALLGYAGWITIERRRLRRVYLSTMVVSIASTALVTLRPEVGWRTTWMVYHAILLGLSATLVIRWTIERTQVTVDTIFAALSGYYLLGFCWAVVYALIDLTVADAFSAPLVTVGPLEEALYFSFVTLTTLGYGDVVPTHPLTQALVTSEALVGQIYLVVLVARLVAIRSAAELSPDAGGTRSDHREFDAR